MTDAPSDVEALRAALAAARVEAAALAEEAARARAMASGAEAVIATLRLEIEKLRRALYGQRSERRARLLDQLELQLEELEATASEDDLAAERAAARTGTAPAAAGRRHPARKPFPTHLPRERVVIEAPCACAACGSGRIAKLGEDVTETLEMVPRSWKVIQTVREKYAGPATASGSPSRRRRSTPRRAAGQGRTCWPPSCSRSSASISRSTARPSVTPAKASPSASPRWPTRSARRPRRSHRSTR